MAPKTGSNYRMVLVDLTTHSGVSLEVLTPVTTRDLDSRSRTVVNIKRVLY